MSELPLSSQYVIYYAAEHLIYVVIITHGLSTPLRGYVESEEYKNAINNVINALNDITHEKGYTLMK